MSLYWLVFVFLIFLYICEEKSHKAKFFYYIGFLTLLLMIVLRYGQGVDYFAYAVLYNEFPGTIAEYNLNYLETVHTEIGWQLLNVFVKQCGLNYVVFLNSCGLLSMVLINKGLKYFKAQSVMALLICYHTVYLTYLFSAIRTGLVISIFLGIILPAVIEKKWVIFFACTIICALFHTSAILFLIVPIIMKIKTKLLELIYICSFVIGIVLCLGVLDSILYRIMPASYVDSGVSALAILQRLASLIVVFWGYWSLREKFESNMKIQTLYKVYLGGMIIYNMLIRASFVASRLAILFTACDFILVSIIIKVKEKNKGEMIIAMLLVTFLLTATHIRSYIRDGSYNSNITVFQYPYVSIFNPDAIEDYCNNIYMVQIRENKEMNY